MTLVFYCAIIAVVLLLIIGFASLLTSRNFIRILISLEVLMKAVTLMIISVGMVTHRIELTQSLVITLIIVEVVMIAVAAGIVIGIHKHYDTLDSTKLRNLKG